MHVIASYMVSRANVDEKGVLGWGGGKMDYWEEGLKITFALFTTLIPPNPNGCGRDAAVDSALLTGVCLQSEEPFANFCSC